MPNIAIAVSGRVATADTAEIVNGNSDYTLIITTDSEWSRFDSPQVVITSYLFDGTTETATTGLAETVALPVQHNAYAVEIGLTASDDDRTISTVPARISCAECITDGDAVEAAPIFDVYNVMMEYLATRDAALYDALTDYREHMPDQPDFPSAEYRRAIAAPCRITKLTGALTYAGGETIELTGQNLASESVSIAMLCMDGDYLLPGSVPTAELTADLILPGQTEETLAAAEITLSFWIQLLTGAWYEVPLGTFTVAGVGDASGGLHVTAYDDMYRLDHITLSQLSIVEGLAYTPQQIIEMCAAAAGLDYDGDVSGFVNAGVSFILSKVSSRVETARDLLMHTVQIIGAIAYVDRHRKLRVVQIGSQEPTVTITANQRKEIAAEHTQYRLYKLTTTFEYPSEEGNTVVEAYESYTLWGSGVTADLPENPLYTVLNTVQQYHAGLIRQCIENLVNMLDPVVFTPFNAELYGDPAVEPLEWRACTYKGATFTAPITETTWAYNSSHAVAACGADAIAGIAKTQAQKAALAERVATADAMDNWYRYSALQIIHAMGHAGMGAYKHDWLGHFTHAELSGEE